MKKLLFLLPLLLIISCAKVPQIEVDAANAALVKLESNVDVSVYMPELIKPIQNEAQKMNSFIQTKKYDLAKSSALSVVASVDNAIDRAIRKKADSKVSAEEVVVKLEKFSLGLLILTDRVEKSPRLLEAFPNIKIEMQVLLSKLNGVNKMLKEGNYLETYSSGSKLLSEMMNFESKIASLVAKLKK